MDVKLLYTVIAAADCGSFAEAGVALGISISSVSLHIKTLEEETELTFFDRKSRPPVLTEAGRDFVQRARDVVAHWESLSDSLTKDPARGVLKIGAVHTTVAGVVPAALLRLRQERPELNVQLTTDLSHGLEDKLHRHLLDCAIVTRPERIDAELAYEAIAKEPLMVIAHRSVAGQDVRRILQGQPYVRFNRRARVAKLIEVELAKRRIAVSSHMEIETLDAVISLVRNALGVSIVPVRTGDPAFAEDIKAVPLGSPPCSRELGVLWRRDSPKGHLVSFLVQALQSQYRPER